MSHLRFTRAVLDEIMLNFYHQVGYSGMFILLLGLIAIFMAIRGVVLIELIKRQAPQAHSIVQQIVETTKSKLSQSKPGLGKVAAANVNSQVRADSHSAHANSHGNNKINDQTNNNGNSYGDDNGNAALTSLSGPESERYPARTLSCSISNTNSQINLTANAVTSITVEPKPADFTNLNPQPPVPGQGQIQSEPIFSDGASEIMVNTLMQVQMKGVYSAMYFLKLCAAIGPLLGLLGTVLGMVDVFSTLSSRSMPDPSLLAGGIWEALLTTVMGLTLAIPALIVHYYLLMNLRALRNRINLMLCHLI